MTGFEDVGDDVVVLSCHRLDSSSVTAVRCLKTKALKIKKYSVVSFTMKRLQK